MESLLILPLAGLVLPTRYALGLGAVGIIGLLALGVYGNTPLNPGVRRGYGVAIVFMFFVLPFGGIAAGLVARGLWQGWRGGSVNRGDLAVGLQGLPPDPAAQLMGLPAPKPIILQTADPSVPQYLRWSFRWHGFVNGGISAADVHCTPMPP